MFNEVIGQDRALVEIRRIFDIFINSDQVIKPHFFLTGPSGSGKTNLINFLAREYNITMLSVNAAQLTKEGTSGSSLSKALSPMLTIGKRPVIIFVDEFDKLFIAGNTNCELAHEATTGVQNEFLKVIEGGEASVFGDYGKYVNINLDHAIFIFTGAFNNESDIDLDRLREIGIKTEFLGRVGLIYNLDKLSLEEMFKILESSKLLDTYLNLFTDVKREDVIKDIKTVLVDNYEMNTLGARMINTLIHKYFVSGGLLKDDPKIITFQKQMKLN